MSSPLKKRGNAEANNLEDVNLYSHSYETGKKSKKVVQDEDSEAFDENESVSSIGDRDFDVEKYKKWREEHGGEDEEDAGEDEGGEGGEDEMIEMLEEGEADNSDDYASDAAKDGK